MSSLGPGRAGTPAPPGPPDLAGLLARVAGGDREAFALVYDATAPAVYGTARRVLRDPDLAAEVTQDVMVEVWRNAARFDPGRGSARAWVTTIGHRRAVDRVRAVQAQRTRDDLAAQREYSPPFDDVQESVERDVEQTRVRECLESLSDLQRDAVVRAFYRGRSYREVAEDLSVALPTVKSRIRDGLTRLRHCLGVGDDA
ncbi:RNA polymerase sigma-70 factor, ECF subfamily [Georgenia satyanarayanai]|uniref:RNA polymerase sigma-70 factor, ECF subfamily n=1 Tax=Georgenia satyanarayanai TaxID=860221 RepID=A0A2Y9C053_9MICO|nr:ECF RNA polymerase sigma factor SigK [Georgenia satyanarayanai]PYF97812.1 RNA polymerase sigma-70 factor (ECF subfamily) [Georgenia satyanarayanai]SSA45552.1 RNA polymerase sigma-70 factor, ECF subfamily [Georgenia satyanarayanai]